MTSCFHTTGQWARIKHDVILEEVRQVAVSVDVKVATVFGRVHQNAALGAKSDIHD